MSEDSGSEAGSIDFEREQEGYNSEEDFPVEEINNKFNELILDKFRLITAFNGGTMSVNTYLIVLLSILLYLFYHFLTSFYFY